LFSPLRRLRWLVVAGIFSAASLLIPAVARGQQTPAPAAAPASSVGASSSTDQEPVLPNGKKLYLKDGSFQLVREYQVVGDRVRYYSLDSQQWEEMPESMVDWGATKKAAAQEQQERTALVKQAEKEQIEQNAEPLDIDASIEIAPKVFLPNGNGLFAFDGKSIVPMTEAQPEGNLSKEKTVEQILIPIPIVPTRHNIYIPGTRAKLRLKSGQPEFYLRTTEQDEPVLDVIRTKAEKGKRLIENLDEMYGERRDVRKTVPIHIMQMADGVFRVTVEANLSPGEYAVIEALRGANGAAADERGEMNLYVWDFAVDASTDSHAAAK
jgi:hypothetical protein